MSPEIKDLLQKYGPYLEELRKRIFFSAIFFAFLFVAGFAISPIVIKWFVAFFSSENVSYVVSSPFQTLTLSINIGLCVALTLFLPFLLSQIYTFISPALRRREKFLVAGYTLTSIGLFVTGFTYGALILYGTFFTVIHYNSSLGLSNLWDVGTFFSQLVSTSVLLGIVFQFPLILHAAVRSGFITVEFLRQQRRVAIASSVVIVALLPPTDGLSLLVMALPLLGMYEGVLFLNRFTHKAVRSTGHIYSLRQQDYV